MMNLPMRLLTISAVYLVVGAVAIALSLSLQSVSLPLAFLAWAVCVISSLVAHVVGEYPSGDDYFMARLARSMVARSGPPFLVVIISKLSPVLPFESGFVLLIVLFYLVGLIADVALQVLRINAAG